MVSEMRAVDLFARLEAEERESRREAIIQSGWATWGWPGPAEGALCEIDLPCPATPDGAPLYCYTEQARLIELQPDGRWLAEIAMPGDWYKNGRRVLLDRDYIGPPRRLIRALREAA